ncbi:MAG: F-type H+-transporting ATPase subunit gamma [Acidimicrobiaceae bacterium]|nr:F-type H+-transporting ATPase subunit gamma [Acidimicrobiaceae bacterium]
MAGGVERALRRRIKSIQSTKKITRAMELIAASRIVRAQQRVLAARPYIEQLTAVIANLARAGAGLSHPLLETREQVSTVGFVVITADRGLCGGYNANMQRATERAIAREQAAGRDYRLVAVGRKGNNFFRYRRYRIDGSFSGFSEMPAYEDARAIAARVMELYASGEIDQVQLVYTRFLSLGSQRATERQFIPLDPDAIVETAEKKEGGTTDAYEFEPSTDEILAELLPRYVEARLFGALLEAAASEQVARQRAMKAATDNANELIKNLNRIANRARQETITTEIMEIVGGAEGMSQAAAKSHE